MPEPVGLPLPVPDSEAVPVPVDFAEPVAVPVREAASAPVELESSPVAEGALECVAVESVLSVGSGMCDPVLVPLVPVPLGVGSLVGEAAGAASDPSLEPESVAGLASSPPTVQSVSVEPDGTSDPASVELDWVLEAVSGLG